MAEVIKEKFERRLEKEEEFLIEYCQAFIKCFYSDEFKYLELNDFEKSGIKVTIEKRDE